MRRILIFLCLAALSYSCSEYQKVLKKEDVAAKYELGERLYNEGSYKKANRLFTQIAPQYTGKPQGERVMFFLADTYYKIEDYNLAGYQFERFLKSYPKSEKAVEAAFQGAKSYYMLSPRYSLDQTDTDKALVKLQIFINTFPDSEFMAEANAMAKELTSKKEKKSYEIARQYTRLGNSYILDYSLSAVASLDNFVSDNPGSIYREDALYQKLVATTNLALNSTLYKKKERLQEAKAAHTTLFKLYPETKYADKANDLADQLNDALANLTPQAQLTK